MKVALRSFAGYYVCAEGGGTSPLVANRTQARGWETFEVIEYPDNNIALIATNGKPVTAEYGGGGILVTNRERDRIAGWELFKVVRAWQGGLALRCCNGQYLWAESGGGKGISASKSEISSFTVFDLVLSFDESTLFTPGDGLWGGLDGNAGVSLPEWAKIIIKINPYSDNTPENMRTRERQEKERRQQERDRVLRENYNRDILDRDSPEDRDFGRDIG